MCPCWCLVMANRESVLHVPAEWRRGDMGSLGWVTSALFAGSAVVLMILWLPRVATLGKNIPSNELSKDYLTAVLWAAILMLVLLAWPLPSKEKKILLLIWFLKCFVTLFLMLFYEAHYWDLDAYEYFSSALGKTAPGIGFLGDGTQTVSWLAWAQTRFLPVSYHALKVTWSAVGLAAIFTFYRAASIYLHRPAYGLLCFLGMFPSILFWSSILGKDPLCLFGIALYVYGVIAWYQSAVKKHLFLVVLGLLIVAAIRTWLAPALILPACVLLLRSSHITTKAKVWGSTLFLLLFAVAFFSLEARFAIRHFDEALGEADAISRSWSVGGSAQEMPTHIDSIAGLARFLPIGMFTALFRPLPGDVPGLFGLLAGLENLGLLAVVVAGLLRIRRRDLADAILVWAFLLIVCWASEYAIVSYQNLGSAVRFKLQILPVLLAFALRLLFRKKTQERLA